jgi:hypothetical protein
MKGERDVQFGTVEIFIRNVTLLLPLVYHGCSYETDVLAHHGCSCEADTQTLLLLLSRRSWLQRTIHA